MEKPNYKPLYLQVKDILVSTISKMKPGKNKLPSEEELTKRLGVSRSTVREALNSLTLDGVIRKRHGRGNFAYPTVLRLPYRVDRYPDFSELLGRNGEVKVETSEHTIGKPSEKMLRRMPESEGEAIVKWEWSYYLDDKLAIITRVEVPQKYFTGKLGFYVKEFASLNSDKDIAYFISWINAGIDEKVAERFQCQNKILQIWEEVFKDVYDNSICFNEIFYNPDIVDLSIVTAI